MDKHIKTILEYLEPFGVGFKVDIAQFINERFPFKKGLQPLEYTKIQGDISRFLQALREYTDLDDAVTYDMADFRREPLNWYNQLNTAITNDGVKYLKIERDRENQEAVQQSAVDTNNSIQETNRSVLETNKAIIENSKSQTLVNETIAHNSLQQTNIFKRQTWIFLTTALLALAALIVSIVNIIEDNQKQQLQKQLTEKDKELNLLRNQLLQLKNKTYQPLDTKRTVPKTH